MCVHMDHGHHHPAGAESQRAAKVGRAADMDECWGDRSKGIVGRKLFRATEDTKNHSLHMEVCLAADAVERGGEEVEEDASWI